MRCKTKRKYLPSKEMVLDIIRKDPGASEAVLSFYEGYIQKMATDPVFAADGSRTGYFYDEDLAQELRIALTRSLPVLREVLLNVYYEKRPTIVIVTDSKK